MTRLNFRLCKWIWSFKTDDELSVEYCESDQKQIRGKTLPFKWYATSKPCDWIGCFKIAKIYHCERVISLCSKSYHHVLCPRNKISTFYYMQFKTFYEEYKVKARYKVTDIFLLTFEICISSFIQSVDKIVKILYTVFIYLSKKGV